MNRHLEEQDIDAVLAGSEISGEAAAHLEACLVCRRAVADVESMIAARRRHQLGDAPDWDHQREQILERVAEIQPVVVLRPRRRLRGWVAAAAAIVVGAGIVALQIAPDLQPEHTEIPVEQILAEADALLAADAVPGFELIDPFLGETNEAELEYENGAS